MPDDLVERIRAKAVPGELGELLARLPWSPDQPPVELEGSSSQPPVHHGWGNPVGPPQRIDLQPCNQHTAILCVRLVTGERVHVFPGRATTLVSVIKALEAIEAGAGDKELALRAGLAEVILAFTDCPVSTTAIGIQHTALIRVIFGTWTSQDDRADICRGIVMRLAKAGGWNLMLEDLRRAPPQVPASSVRPGPKPVAEGSQAKLLRRLRYGSNYPGKLAELDRVGAIRLEEIKRPNRRSLWRMTILVPEIAYNPLDNIG